MLLEIAKDFSQTQFIRPLSIDAFGEDEKKLEECITNLIGDVLFPELLVFGNERSYKPEPDIFAVNGKGDLVVFELKVNGEYDRTKTLQAMDYAQRYSHWKYLAINKHYKKGLGQGDEFIELFEEHFGYKIDEGDFNRNQKIIVISHSSSIETSNMANYWKEKGVDIQEYFYRFYEIGEKTYFELSNELYNPADNRGSCWINTNARWGKFCYFDMVKNQKVSAYGNRGELIGKWLNKAIIFLYHNGYGIIAGGYGTSKIEDTYYNDEKGYDDDERNIKLKSFLSGVNMESGEIEKYIPASRIKELLGRDFYFPTTIVPLDDSEAKILYDECEKIFT